MIFKVIERLKTGPVTNVYLYGHNANPSPPYVVVKEEPFPGRGTHLRVFAHFLPGQQKFLRSYVRSTLLTLLEDYQAESGDGNVNIVLSENQISDTLLNEEDGTISRVFSEGYMLGDLLVRPAQVEVRNWDGPVAPGSGDADEVSAEPGADEDVAP